MSNLLQFFKYEHLKPELQEVSKPFCLLAEQIATTLPNNAEKTVALRKLLEAKDCAVRAVLYVDPVSLGVGIKLSDVAKPSPLKKVITSYWYDAPCDQVLKPTGIAEEDAQTIMRLTDLLCQYAEKAGEKGV